MAGFSNCLFEVMYSEPCPMIKAYCCEAGRYIPVFSQVENPNTEQLKRNNELLRMFMDHLSKQPEHKAAMLCQKDIAGKLYETIMSRPNRWEAKYYGMQLFSDDLSDEHMRCIANRLTQREIKDLRILSKLCIMLGLSKKVIHESGWIEGTIVNAGEHISSNLRSARMAKYVTHLRQSLKAKKIKMIAMFETVGVMAVSACILQMVYEKIEYQRPVVDYTEENKKFREQKEQEAKEWSVQILPYLEKEKEQRSEPPVICVEDLTMRFRIATNNVSGI